MTEYLSKNQVLVLHTLILKETGGQTGLGDEGLLESALGRPQASFAGQDLYPSLAGKAAALMHSLVSNHPFVDGNKRVAVASAELFLLINGYRVEADNVALEELTLASARADIGQEQIRIWFDQHIEALQ